MAKGKPGVPGWQYDFDCWKCLNIKTYEDGVRRCRIMAEGKKCIHADEDRHVRADYFTPKEKAHVCKRGR